MKAEDLKHAMDHLPAKQEVFVRQGDNAYPAKIRFFKENGKTIPYIEIDMEKKDYHRNFPEGYRGAEEVKI